VSQIESARVKNSRNPVIASKTTLLLSLPIILYPKSTFANRPPFWTKTDLRTAALFGYTTNQSPPKTTHSEPREMPCFVINTEILAPSFSLWRDCRGIAPVEGTERNPVDCTSRVVSYNCRGIAPVEGTERPDQLRGGGPANQYCRGIAPVEGTESCSWIRTLKKCEHL
jgi:hypothetical protein